MNILGYCLLIVVGAVIYFYINLKITEKHVPSDAHFSEILTSYVLGLPFFIFASVCVIAHKMFFPKS